MIRLEDFRGLGIDALWEPLKFSLEHVGEFGYGGISQPSFPSWLIDGTKPSRLARLLKEKILPPSYWKAMLKRRKWLAAPQKIAAG